MKLESKEEIVLKQCYIDELGFSLFDVTRDRDVLRAASEAARNVMKEGSEYSLSVNPPLRRKYAEYSESQEKNLIL